MLAEQMFPRYLMSEQKKKKGFRFNPKLTITIVIVILVAALGIGLILNYRRNNDEQKITAKNAKTTAAASTAASTLPAEASDINSYTYLLNKDTASLDPTYVPSDLADPENVQSTSSVFEIRAEAATQLEAMVKAASDVDITLYVSSGYRSYDDQDKLYSSQVQLLTEAKAITACEKAGYSEHQLGLAVDLTDDVNTTSQTEAFADTDAGKWLYEHAHEYGFILRYPKGKESITKYNFMPWHYRYVGTDTANAMYAISPDETMEEYFSSSN